MPNLEDSAENSPAIRMNYRVLEFVAEDGEAWRSVHEVYCVDGVPSGYSEHPAAVVWDTDKGDTAAPVILERMREALSKPVLTNYDFRR